MISLDCGDYDACSVDSRLDVFFFFFCYSMSQQFTLAFVYRRTLQRDQVIKHDTEETGHTSAISCVV